MFIAALFPIAKIWQLPKCPSNSEWIRRCVYSHTHTVDYYSTIKKNELLLFAATWADLKSTLLNEMSGKNRNYMMSLMCEISKVHKSSKYNKKEAGSQIQRTN